jgi:hypothetical protein
MRAATNAGALRASAEHPKTAGLDTIWVADHVAIPPGDTEGSGGRCLGLLEHLGGGIGPSRARDGEELAGTRRSLDSSTQRRDAFGPRQGLGGSAAHGESDESRGPKRPRTGRSER